MYNDLQANSKKLLVVSDTAMQYTKEGVVAFGPVLRELTHLLEVFSSIRWIGFNKGKKDGSLILIKNCKIEPILLNDVGGKTWKDKLEIIASYPKMIKIILNEVKKHQFIHSRAPSNPAVIVMFLSLFFSKKQFWHKYAGSWIDSVPFFYNLQRFFLKFLRKNSKVTINGDFNSSNKNVIAFENPCLDRFDRQNGEKIMTTKTISNTPLRFCFVGRLTGDKGVGLILESLRQIHAQDIDSIHFVGDGSEKSKFEKTAKKIRFTTIFHGHLPKDAVSEVYSLCDFIVLPSRSEGFPKVIGEAMNYGCIPIVSDISCISQYIHDQINGFLIHPRTPKEILKKIHLARELTNKEKARIHKYNFQLAEKFTYSYYNKRVMTEIFETN